MAGNWGPPQRWQHQGPMSMEGGGPMGPGQSSQYGAPPPYGSQGPMGPHGNQPQAMMGSGAQPEESADRRLMAEEEDKGSDFGASDEEEAPKGKKSKKKQPKAPKKEPKKAPKKPPKASAAKGKGAKKGKKKDHELSDSEPEDIGMGEKMEGGEPMAGIPGDHAKPGMQGEAPNMPGYSGGSGPHAMSGPYGGMAQGPRPGMYGPQQAANMPGGYYGRNMPRHQYPGNNMNMGPAGGSYRGQPPGSMPPPQHGSMQHSPPYANPSINPTSSAGPQGQSVPPFQGPQQAPNQMRGVPGEGFPRPPGPESSHYGGMGMGGQRPPHYPARFMPPQSATPGSTSSSSFGAMGSPHSQQPSLHSPAAQSSSSVPQSPGASSTASSSHDPRDTTASGVTVQRDKRKHSGDDNQVVQAKLWRPGSPGEEEKPDASAGQSQAKNKDATHPTQATVAPPQHTQAPTQESTEAEPEAHKQATVKEGDDQCKATEMKSQPEEQEEKKQEASVKESQGKESEGAPPEVKTKSSESVSQGSVKDDGSSSSHSAKLSTVSKSSVETDSDSVSTCKDIAPSGSVSSESHQLEQFDSASNSSAVTPQTSQAGATESSSSLYPMNFPGSPQVFMDLDNRCHRVESFEPAQPEVEKPQLASLGDQSDTAGPGSPKVLLDLDNQARSGSNSSSSVANGHCRSSSPKQFLDLDQQQKQQQQDKGAKGKKGKGQKAGAGSGAEPRMGGPGSTMYPDMAAPTGLPPAAGGFGGPRQGGQHPVMMMQGMMERFGDGGMGGPAGMGHMGPGGVYPPAQAYGAVPPQHYPHPMQVRHKTTTAPVVKCIINL